MSKPVTQQYEKLPGGYRAVFTLSSRAHGTLWLGSDHVLLVRSTEFSETVRRVFLKDIELVTITPSRDRIWATLLVGTWALLALLAGYGILYAFDFGGGAPLAGFVASVLAAFAAWTVWYWQQGPTGRVRIHTAVHSDDVLALTRLRKAEQAFAILLPKIAEVQGRMEDELLRREPEPERVWMPSRHAVAAPATEFKPKPRFKPGWHYAFYIWMIWGEVLSITALLVQTEFVTWLGGYHMLIYVAIAAGALTVQHRSNSSAMVRGITWAAIATQFAQFSIAGMYSFFIGMQNPLDPEALSRAQTALNASPAAQAMTVAFAAALTAMAVLGILELRRGGQGPLQEAPAPVPGPAKRTAAPPPLPRADTGEAAPPPLPDTQEESA